MKKGTGIDTGTIDIDIDNNENNKKAAACIDT